MALGKAFAECNRGFAECPKHSAKSPSAVVAQPEGYAVKGKEQYVLKLSKALYGFRPAPRAWNIKLDGSLKKLGFTKCPS